MDKSYVNKFIEGVNKSTVKELIEEAARFVLGHPNLFPEIKAADNEYGTSKENGIEQLPVECMECTVCNCNSVNCPHGIK